MKLLNPCNKCIVQPSCIFKDDLPTIAELHCPLLYDYLMTTKILLYIPKHISRISKDTYKGIKYMYRGESILIKILVTILLMCQVFNVIFLIGGLFYALVKGLTL